MRQSHLPQVLLEALEAVVGEEAHGAQVEGEHLRGRAKGQGQRYLCRCDGGIACCKRWVVCTGAAVSNIGHMMAK